MIADKPPKRLEEGRGERIVYRIDRPGYNWSCGGDMERRKDSMVIDEDCVAVAENIKAVHCDCTDGRHLVGRILKWQVKREMLGCCSSSWEIILALWVTLVLVLEATFA